MNALNDTNTSRQSEEPHRYSMMKSGGLIIAVGVLLFIDLQLSFLNTRLHNDMVQVEQQFFRAANALRRSIDRLPRRTEADATKQEPISQWKTIGLVDNEHWDNIDTLASQCNEKLSSSNFHCVIIHPEDARLEELDVIFALPSVGDVVHANAETIQQHAAWLVELQPQNLSRDDKNLFASSSTYRELFRDSEVTHAGLQVSMTVSKIQHPQKTSELHFSLDISTVVDVVSHQMARNRLCRDIDDAPLVYFNALCRRYPKSKSRWQNFELVVHETDDDNNVVELH